jgi:hypothetical protein
LGDGLRHLGELLAGEVAQPRAEIAPPAIQEERDGVGGAAPQSGAHALDRGPAALDEQRIGGGADVGLAQPCRPLGGLHPGVGGRRPRGLAPGSAPLASDSISRPRSLGALPCSISTHDNGCLSCLAIDLLGLAQFGASDKVATILYKRGAATTGDENYNKALRLAVLGNPLLPRQIMSRHSFGIVGDEEILNFLEDNDEKDELSVVLKNAGAKKLLSKIYNQEEPFDKLPMDSLIRAVYWSCSNPAINDDDSGEHGPDMDAWHLQEGIKKLLEAMPVTENGLMAMYWLLKSVDPRHKGIFHKDPTPIFERWAALQLSEDFKKYHDSDCWDLDMKEEFLCLLGALFGCYSEPDAKQITYLGSADSPDRALRCAYYSREKFTAEQMQKAYDKDTDAFTMAALYNDKLFWQPATRGKLEELIRGHLIHRYRRRCEQIKQHYKEFDLKPVSETGTALLDDKIEQPTEDQKRLERLEVMAAANVKQLNSIYKVLTWVLVLVIVAILMIWRPHF